MLTIAVTGGIGAGKSTVSAMLGELGAVVIDSDRLAREVVAPGTSGLAAVAAAFGRGVLRPDGELDRAALAAIVFDPADGGAARARLEAITHPLVRAEFRRLRDEAGRRDSGSVVVNDIPLLRTRAEAAAFDLVIVVVAPEERRIDRLIERGLTAHEARARIAAQIGDSERVALADIVIHNDGDPDDLREQVERIWWDRLRGSGVGAENPRPEVAETAPDDRP